MLDPQPSGDVEAVHAPQGEVNEDGVVRPNTEVRLHLCRTRCMDSLETHVSEVLCDRWANESSGSTTNTRIQDLR